MAQILVPTSLFTIQDLKTHTEQTQAHFTFLSLIYSPNLSSHSPTFPSATIYIRIFSPSLNNAKACQGTAQVQRKKTSRDARQTTTAGHAAGAASLPQERGFGKAAVLTYPLCQGRDPRGRCLRSLGRALLQRAALIIHPVTLELAQQVKEAFLVRRGPVDFLQREREESQSHNAPNDSNLCLCSFGNSRALSWSVQAPGCAKPHSLEPPWSL